jgi:hypothetical protein
LHSSTARVGVSARTTTTPTPPRRSEYPEGGYMSVSSFLFLKEQIKDIIIIIITAHARPARPPRDPFQHRHPSKQAAAAAPASAPPPRSAPPTAPPPPPQRAPASPAAGTCKRGRGLAGTQPAETRRVWTGRTSSAPPFRRCTPQARPPPLPLLTLITSSPLGRFFSGVFFQREEIERALLSCASPRRALDPCACPRCARFFLARFSSARFFLALLPSACALDPGASSRRGPLTAANSGVQVKKRKHRGARPCSRSSLRERLGDRASAQERVHAMGERVGDD